MLAVSRGNAGMVELLLDAGADVNETDNVRLGFVFLLLYPISSPAGTNGN